MSDLVTALANVSLFAVLLKTTPVLLAALGGAFTHQAGILNISLEGLILLGSFITVSVGGATDSIPIGLLAAVIGCVAASLLFAWATLWGKADFIVVGIGVNLLIAGLTVFLLNQLYGSSGSITPGNISGVWRVDLGPTSGVPVLGALHGQTVFTVLAFVAVPVCAWLMYRTPFGQHVRAVGEDVEASRASGLDPVRIKTLALGISGLACAIAGAQLALATLESFNQGMTAGRGFIAVAALIFASGRPWLVLVITLVFGYAQSAADQLQLQGTPSALATMLPYVITVVALAVAAARALLARRAAAQRAPISPPRPAPVRPSHDKGRDVP